MSVAAASGAVSTHRPTQEQIRLAQLIEDKKHDQPEVQEIVRKVLDVVGNSNQDDALLALFDCDYDYEKAVALLIEKGHDVASEWRTATNHKISKKQQQKTLASTKNGHEGFGGEADENGQHQQRGHDGSNYRGKSRGGRPRYNQQQNGTDSHNTNQSNEHFNSQHRPRGVGSNYRGRQRGSHRGAGHRPNDRNHQQNLQDGSLDTVLPSDTAQRSTDVSYSSRRGGDGNGAAPAALGNDGRQVQEQHWDVGNWNGETLIYSRTTKEDEQPIEIDLTSVSKSIHGLADASNGQSSSLGASSQPNSSDVNAQQGDFDREEAARQIKNVIGIGQSQQQQNVALPKTLMDTKPIMNNSSTVPSVKASVPASKPAGPNSNTKATPPLPRIPHQPVVFSDRFDGGLSKIDVQFGNLGEAFDETIPPGNITVSNSSAFYAKPVPNVSTGAAATNVSNSSSSVANPPRSNTLTQHSSNEQSAFISTAGQTSATRPSEQLPVMNPRLISSQLQQPSMPMKPVVTSTAYPVHQAQAQMNSQNMMYGSMILRHQQPESVQLENPYDQAAFQLSSTDYAGSYYMAPALSSQQQPQSHYIVPQPAPTPQQVSNNRGSSSINVQTSSVPTSSSATSTSSSAATKKAPNVPPGIFVPANAPTASAYSSGYTTQYGVPLSVGGQQQTAAGPYGTIYDPEHAFNSQFMQFANAQQAQSPTGTYGSVTPPVQQQNQQQQLHSANDKTMNFGGPITENLLLLQQFSYPQSGSQQQGQQGVGHSPAPLNYYMPHTAGGTNFPGGAQIMYAAAATSMVQQQQATKQQGQHYNQRPTNSSNKEGQYMYAAGPGQGSQVSVQSVGQQQQQQQQHQQHQQQQGAKQRTNNNVYNNQQNQQRSFQ